MWKSVWLSISWQQTDFDPPLAATSWSAPPPRTSAPVHSLWRAQRHGTSCRRIYGH